MSTVLAGSCRQSTADLGKQQQITTQSAQQETIMQHPLQPKVPHVGATHASDNLLATKQKCQQAVAKQHSDSMLLSLELPR